MGADQTIAQSMLTKNIPVRRGFTNLEQVCQHLLEGDTIEKAWIELGSGGRIHHYSSCSSDVPREPLLIHSATDTGGHWDIDTQYDYRILIGPAIEARSHYLGREESMIITRFPPTNGGNYLNTLSDGPKFYNLTEELLWLAIKEPGYLEGLIQQIRDRKVVISVYALDDPLVVFLVWLQRMADVDIYVDANSPDVSSRMNRKTILHPHVKSVTTETNSLTAERELGPLNNIAPDAKQIPTPPGYSIGPCHSMELMGDQMWLAAQSLIHKHEIYRGCLKNAEATDGGKQVKNIPLDNQDALVEAVNELFEPGASYVLEAHITSATNRVRYKWQDTLYEKEVQLNCSVQIENGEVVGVTAQDLDGSEWIGNGVITPDNCVGLGISIEEYWEIVKAAEQFASIDGLVTASLDAILTDDPHIIDIMSTRVCIVDPNIRSNGGIYAHKTRARAIQYCQEHQIEHVDVAARTRVIKPKSGITTAQVQQALQAVQSDYPKLFGNHFLELVAYPPNGGWAMFAYAEVVRSQGGNSKSALTAYQKVLILEHLLVETYQVAEHYDQNKPITVDLREA